MDAINPTMSTMDVAIVIGAGDVVNPAAREVKSSPIYGMPIINVDALSSSSKRSWHPVSPESKTRSSSRRTLECASATPKRASSTSRDAGRIVQSATDRGVRVYCEAREDRRLSVVRPGMSVATMSFCCVERQCRSWKRYLHCHSVTPEPD